MARYDCNNENKEIANDLIYPRYGLGDAYLTGVFTGSDFELTILHVSFTFCAYGNGLFSRLLGLDRLDLNTQRVPDLHRMERLHDREQNETIFMTIFLINI